MQRAPADIESLYAELSGRLQQLVRLGVRAPDPLIEDACQFAWMRFVFLSDHVRHDAALSWLVKTAIHEAFKLIRRERRELSLDAMLEQAPEALAGCPEPSPEDLVERRERLETIRALPERQQRLVWLRGLGLSYSEMALHTGCTPRTVERQLFRAGQRLRETASV
jgi:RNA polymerase sigma factor (sigma-70 family)